MFIRYFVVCCVVPSLCVNLFSQVELEQPITAFSVSADGRLGLLRASARERVLPPLVEAFKLERLNIELREEQQITIDALMEEVATVVSGRSQSHAKEDMEHLLSIDKKLESFVSDELKVRVQAGRSRREFYRLGPIGYLRKLGVAEDALVRCGERMRSGSEQMRADIRDLGMATVKSVLDTSFQQLPRSHLEALIKVQSSDALAPSPSIHFKSLRDVQDVKYGGKINLIEAFVLKLNDEGVLTPFATSQRNRFFEALTCL